MPIFFSASNIFDLSESEAEAYNVVMLGVCISIKRPTAAIPVSVANNVGNARRKPGCSIASRIVAIAALGIPSKF
ncbi:Uncharacterised protein [marine metagenome]